MPTEVNERISALEVKEEARKETISSLMFKIDSLKFLLKNNVAVTTAVVIGFAAAVLFVNAQIVALKDEISTVEDRIDAVEISLNNRIDKVEDRIDEVEDRIDEVEERMIRGFEDMQELLVNIVQRLPQQPVQHSALTLN